MSGLLGTLSGSRGISLAGGGCLSLASTPHPVTGSLLFLLNLVVIGAFLVQGHSPMTLPTWCSMALQDGTVFGLGDLGGREQFKESSWSAHTSFVARRNGNTVVPVRNSAFAAHQAFEILFCMSLLHFYPPHLTLSVPVYGQGSCVFHGEGRAIGERTL